MANGDHDWTAAEIVTAANMDDYLQLQTIEKFATSAARDAALSARKREGQFTVQDDANSLTVYSGAAWSTVGPVHGALTAWVPVCTQSGAVTYTLGTATYSRVGRRIFFEAQLNITGSGTSSNLITLSLPVTALSSNPHGIIGRGYIYDSSATTQYNFDAVYNSTTTLKCNVTSLQYLGTALFTAGLAVNDVFTVNGNYEAAADA